PITIIKGYRFTVIDMMAHVFVAHVFIGAVITSTDNVEPPTKARIQVGAFEDAVVAAVMHQIGGDRHAMGDGQHADNKQAGAALKKRPPATEIAQQDIADGGDIRPQTGWIA